MNEKVPRHIFREYDIRGIAETELNSQTVLQIGRAFGTYLTELGVYAASVGGDVRTSTPRIVSAVTQGLREAGVRVIDIGTVPTPCFYWSLYDLGVDGGVMVTGSHNPADMNGLKLAFQKSTIWGDEIQEIARIIEEDRIELAPEPAPLEQAEIKKAYLDMLVDKITLGPRKLHVVTDCGNGTAGFFAPEFLRRIGCTVTELFTEPDGRFPHHHPDPTKREYLTSLIETVRATHADFGVGFDGDSDRIGVVDDTGEVLWGDRLMALYWQEILPQHPGTPVIIEVKSSIVLEEVAKKLGGAPLWWKSGHSLVKAKMKEENALFSGEVSGHMFFADEYYGYDDAFYAAGRLARILSNSSLKLSEMLKAIPLYPSTAETRFACPDERKWDVVERMKGHALAEGLETITVDGVRILYPHGWGLLRASNTQPVLVARCEAHTTQELDAICGDVKKRVAAAGGPDFEWEY